MPTARDHLSVGVVKGKLYAIGGRLESYARNLGVNEEYDPLGDKWIEKAPLPTPRSGITASVVNYRIYVFGGESTEGTFDTNEMYDPAADLWQTLQLMPTARHGLGSTVVDGKIYVIAGGLRPGGSMSGVNEAFTP
jgi:hypothetical protein